MICEQYSITFGCAHWELQTDATSASILELAIIWKGVFLLVWSYVYSALVVWFLSKTLGKSYQQSSFTCQWAKARCCTEGWPHNGGSSVIPFEPKRFHSCQIGRFSEFSVFFFSVMGSVLNPLNTNISIQIPLTDLYTFPYRIKPGSLVKFLMCHACEVWRLNQ